MMKVKIKLNMLYTKIKEQIYLGTCTFCKQPTRFWGDKQAGAGSRRIALRETRIKQKLWITLTDFIPPTKSPTHLDELEMMMIIIIARNQEKLVLVVRWCSIIITIINQ